MNIDVIQSNSKGNLIKLSDGHTSILLECGLSLSKMRNLGVGLGDIEGCLCSHFHSDHSKSAEKLLDIGIPVYTSEGTAKELNIKNNYFCKLVESRVKFEAGSLLVRPFPLQHDTPEPLGFFIYSRETKERLMFATDTYYIEPVFPKLNYMLIECSYIESLLEKYSDELNDIYIDRLRQSHLSLSMLLDYLDKTNLEMLKEVYILHVSGQVGVKSKIKKAVMRKTGLPVKI